MLNLIAFLRAALPWVLTGGAIAILAANYNSAQKRESIALGAALGLMFGVALNSAGVWENHILGILIGPLWGMSLTTLRKTPPSNTD